ncbi:MAG: transglycosylase SLT domain-containing protein [Dehalococcoidia bacterium]|nr:transglycosylase SLT domain-containing protein [Dehalococcoidia bacterium]
MRIGAAGPTPPEAGTPPEAARAPGDTTASFSAVLAERLRAPRDEIELTRAAMRAAVADARSGAPLLGSREPTPTALSTYSRPSAASSAGGDPFGWRQLTRTLGDEAVAPGFGRIFEAQIQQESGFDPEVVFGYRRSSAGAEGIAQLMPQYYQHVNRRDPEASLRAAADSMRHYLAANGGDVRKALASYNAGLGTVQSLVAAHGANWERGLPAETKQYLAAIVGGAVPTADTRGNQALPFGGRGPHGVLSPPVAGTARDAGDALEWVGDPGAAVNTPADGVVTAVGGTDGARTLTLDHGNGWTTVLEGLGSIDVRRGDIVRRGQSLGALTRGGEEGILRLGLAHRGQSTAARPYVIPAG